MDTDLNKENTYTLFSIKNLENIVVSVLDRHLMTVWSLTLFHPYHT